MKTIVECLDTISAARHDVENWLGRLSMTSTFEPTVPGRARKFSRVNVIELSSIAAFVAVGWPPLTAAAMAGSIVRNTMAHAKQRKWCVFANANTTGFWTDELDAGRLEVEAATSTGIPIIKIVNVGEIIRRVDELFAEE